MLSTRARKDVKVEDIKVRVCLFAFDCLYKNGKTLLRESLTARRAALLESVQEKFGELQIAKAKVRDCASCLCLESHDLTHLRTR